MVGVDIAFADASLRELCNNSKGLRRRYGAEGEKKIRRRFDELAAAGTLAVLRSLPGPRCEELKGSRKGQLSVRLQGAFRLIFEPQENPPPAKPDGGLDWTAITAIRVLAIEDYHD
jgi:proteic killer suppression protein